MIHLGTIISLPTKHKRPATREYLVCFDHDLEKPWHLSALLKSGMLGRNVAGSYFHSVRELDAYIKLASAIKETQHVVNTRTKSHKPRHTSAH
jgi:hypothetical protein